MSFSEQVKKVKAEKGITNEKLSARSGIPFSTINKILSNDEANPKLDVVIAIAVALECPISYLIDGEGDFVNQSLSEEERALVCAYRNLDSHGKELVELVLKKEAERLAQKSEKPSARILTLSESNDVRYRRLPIFDLPASAGSGFFLDGDSAEELEIKVTRTSALADFALRISGDSMEPRFKNGDLLLVKEQKELEYGELGIFIGDGEGFFKRFMGDCLRSLNPKYKDIPLSSFTSFRCCGRVIGQLPR